MIYAVLLHFDFVAKFTIINMNKDFINTGQVTVFIRFPCTFQKIKSQTKNVINMSKIKLIPEVKYQPVSKKELEPRQLKVPALTYSQTHVLYPRLSLKERLCKM